MDAKQDLESWYSNGKYKRIYSWKNGNRWEVTYYNEDVHLQHEGL